MRRPVVLYPGRGVFRVMAEAMKDGQRVLRLVALEGQPNEVDVEHWKVRELPEPLSRYELQVDVVTRRPVKG